MPQIVDKDVIISSEDLAFLLRMDDEDLFRKVKQDLSRELMKNTISLPFIVIPRVRNSALFYGSLILSDEVEAPSKIKFYLIKLQSELEKWLCNDLGYCSNKERVARLIAEINQAADAALSEENLEAIKKELNEIRGYLMGVLFFNVPVSLLVYLLKKGLDLLCKC